MTTTSVLNTMFVRDAPAATDRGHEFIHEPRMRNAHLYGDEQIRSLVQQLFLRREMGHLQQVVFSSVDGEDNVAEICRQVGHALAAQVVGTVCIVEIFPSPARDAWGHDVPISSGCLRDSVSHLSKNLHLMSTDVFLQDEKTLSASWLRGRLDELRTAFDYTIFQAPSSGQYSDPLMLGHLCDGVVLVLAANSTRRVAARKAKERLSLANARLLGTVLSGRQFPIPERIYKRL